MTVKRVDMQWKFYQPGAHITPVEGLSSAWTSGYVRTSEGIVLVNIFKSDKKDRRYTMFEFIAQGIEYRRRFDGKAYSKRFCVTLATRFAKECTA